jgi:2-keto-4-pentenoate hydratase
MKFSILPELELTDLNAQKIQRGRDVVGWWLGLVLQNFRKYIGK